MGLAETKEGERCVGEDKESRPTIVVSTATSAAAAIGLHNGIYSLTGLFLLNTVGPNPRPIPCNLCWLTPHGDGGESAPSEDGGAAFNCENGGDPATAMAHMTRLTTVGDTKPWAATAYAGFPICPNRQMLRLIKTSHVADEVEWERAWPMSRSRSKLEGSRGTLLWRRPGQHKASL